MRRTALNEGWEFRPKQNRHLELVGMGAPWEPVTLPHDAVIGTERAAEAGPATGYFPGGAWEYRRTIEVPEDGAPATAVVEFEGVYRDAIVSVNGTRAAHRPYGYSRFFVPVDHLLQPGENELKVEAIAHEDSRWYSGGGIHRDVWLLEAGTVHLVADRLEVLTPEVDDEVAAVAVATAVRNRGPATSEAVVRVEVVDADGEVVATEQSPVTTFAGEELTVRRRLDVASPRRWRLDDPHLYTCRVTLLDGDEVLDDDATTFGIRTLSLDARRGLRVNGEPVLLRGACVHHDNGPLGSATIGRAEERRVELLKAAGFNALRSAHNPMSRAMLDACDRLGVLVMDETFDMWGQPEDRGRLRPPLRRLVGGRHRGHGPQGRQPPERGHVQHRQRDPGRVLGHGPAPGPGPSRAGAGARPLPLRHPGDQRDHGRRCPHHRGGAGHHGGAGDHEDTGVNTATTSLGDLMGAASSAELVVEPAGRGLLPPRRRRLQLHAQPLRRRTPRPIPNGSSSPARPTRPTSTSGWAGVLEHRNVIGDFTWTGWDYLGEAGIGRIEYGEAAGRVGPRRVPRRVPVAGRVVRRRRHHRAPPSTVLLPGDRVRAPVRPLRRRPAARAPWTGGLPHWSVVVERRGRRAGAGPATRDRRSPSRSTPTPTRSSWW